MSEHAAWSAWPSPAKLNLFLHIIGQRADGYHELQTVFQLLDWGDTVSLRIREDGLIQRLGESVPGVAEADDLLIRAARALQLSSATTLGADIAVEKRIPAGAGFGGGSSNAATVLLALNQLWKTTLTIEELAAIGLKLGADVPVFVHGYSAFAEGVGEKIQPLPLPPTWYVIVDPHIPIATKTLFAAPDLTRDMQAVTIADFVSGGSYCNVFEALLCRREPKMAEVLQTLSTLGRARLTGTGSGCFVGFATYKAAVEAQALLPASWSTKVVAGLNRSPLHATLQTFSSV